MSEQPTTRDKLPPLERAVSDTLDEWLVRHHGIFSSWASPYEFIEWLEKRGYKIIAKETDTCPKCGKVNRGQTGEYPCEVCSLPMVWDGGNRYE